MPGSPSPFVAVQYLDNNGDPADSYQLFTYDAGTTTKRNTYTDYDLTTPNTNPIILDSAGRCTIFLSPVLYKVVLAPPTDTDPPSSPIWTRDNVVPSAGVSNNVDVAVTAGETLAAGDCCYLSDGSGGNTAGRWYKTDADQTYSSNGAYMVGFATAAITSASTGTVRLSGRVTGLSGLTAGTPYYASATAGALTSSAPANGLLVGKADSTTSIVIPPVYGDAGATIRGLVSLNAQSWEGVKTFGDQPLTYIGTATTLPATVAGVVFTDVVTHTSAGGATNEVFSSTTIPANAMNANGKMYKLLLGSSTADTGANNKEVNVDIGGLATRLVRTTSAGNLGSWSGSVEMIRIDSDTMEIRFTQFLATGINIVQSGQTNGFDFTAAIVVRSLATTGAASTTSQTFFILEAAG